MKVQGIDESISFSADRPIEKASQDLLNRAGFAGRLSAAIKSWNGKESLVIGICGRWGAGKSSIKNLIKESLQLNPDDNNPETVEFIPWQVSGEEKLTSAFFDELAKVIGRADKSESAKKTVRLLKLYQTQFRVGTYILNPFPTKTARRLLGLAISLIGLAGWQTTYLSFSVLVVLLFISGVLWIASWLDGLLAVLIDYFEAKHSIQEKSLQEIKGEITAALSLIKKPVLMIIDDIDRLTDEEISLLFRLIKSNADFPNVIYLLLFDRIYVEDALNCLLPSKSGKRGENGRGGEYLKKIVQVVFDLPESDREQVRKILFSNLDRLLLENNAQELFENQRWGLVFADGLDPFFKTVRDVNRYLSSLSFAMGAFKGERKFEVNPLDLICLEVIRVFEPQVYERIKSLKQFIVKTTKRLFQDREKDEAKEELEKIFELASPEFRKPIEVIIKGLFPYTASILGEYSYGDGTVEQWYKQRRICNEELFDRYFEFEVSSNDISNSEIALVIELSNSSDSLLQKLITSRDSKALESLLYALDIHKDEIPADNFANVASAFFALIDTLPRSKGDILDRDPAMSCARILLHLLKKLPTEEVRVSTACSAIEDATGAYLPWYLTFLISRLRQEGWGDLGPIFQQETSIENLNRSLGKLLNTLGAKDRIPLLKAGGLIKHWKEWGDENILTAWANRAVQDDKSLIELIKGYLHGVQTSGSIKMGWAVNVDELGTLTSLDAIDLRVEEVSRKSNLDDLSKLTVQAYQLSRDRQKKGLKTDMFITESYVWSEIREISKSD